MLFSVVEIIIYALCTVCTLSVDVGCWSRCVSCMCLMCHVCVVCVLCVLFYLIR